MYELALTILFWIGIVLGVWSIPRITGWCVRWKYRLEHPKQLAEWWIGEPVYLVAGRYVRWSKIPPTDTDLGQWIRERNNELFAGHIAEGAIDASKISAEPIKASRITAEPLFEDD
mgnify:CR=1 FL=1